MSGSVGDNFNYSLFQLETCLLEHQPKNLIPLLKQVLSFSYPKIPFTSNPGLTLYSPPSTQNLSSQKSALLFIHELSRTGAPVVTVDTAKVLAKNNYFTVVVTMHHGPMLQDLLKNGIPVILDQELASINNYASLMNFTNNHFYADTFAKAFDITFVITAVYYNFIRRLSNFHQNTIWWLHEGSHSYDIFGPHMPRQLSPAIKVYTGGAYAQNQLKNYNFVYKTSVLNYGVTDSFTPSTPPNDHSYPIKFLLPGSISDRKGQNILLEAIKQLPSSYQSKSEFLFIGDITSQYDTKGIEIKSNIIAATKSNPIIKYIPSVNREELYNIYQNIDILTLASLDDPMPVVATEALMLEKPVLCSDTTGTSYYLEDSKNGFIFPSGNASALCSKIKYIIDHQSELKKIGKNGRKVFLKHFEMNIFEKNLMSIMEGVK